MKTTNNRHNRRGAGGRPDDDTCPSCGTAMKPTRRQARLAINGEQILVPDVAHLRCPHCGEGLFTLAQARLLFRSAQAIYRRKHRLLAAAEIGALRRELGLSAAALARALRVNKDLVSRWETERAVQSVAYDALLRVVRDVPGSLDYLRSRAA